MKKIVCLSIYLVFFGCGESESPVTVVPQEESQSLLPLVPDYTAEYSFSAVITGNCGIPDVYSSGTYLTRPFTVELYGETIELYNDEGDGIFYELMFSRFSTFEMVDDPHFVGVIQSDNSFSSESTLVLRNKESGNTLTLNSKLSGNFEGSSWSSWSGTIEFENAETTIDPYEICYVSVPFSGGILQ